MKKDNEILGSIDSIESLGLHDGPGIRIVVFLNGCMLRCKYCHNPEMWNKLGNNYTSNELVEKIKRFRPYIKEDGGVTFSGGEPLLQPEFIIETSKKLKEEGFHIALDTAGVGIGKYQEVLKYIDLVIFDVKAINEKSYKELTGYDIKESLKFLEIAKKLNKKFWIRQVIIPGINDNLKYIKELKTFIKDISNIEKVEFIPYHRLGIEKYEKLSLNYSYQDKEAMDKEKCEELYKSFLEL